MRKTFFRLLLVLSLLLSISIASAAYNPSPYYAYGGSDSYYQKTTSYEKASSTSSTPWGQETVTTVVSTKKVVDRSNDYPSRSSFPIYTYSRGSGAKSSRSSCDAYYYPYGCYGQNPSNYRYKPVYDSSNYEKHGNYCYNSNGKRICPEQYIDDYYYKPRYDYYGDHYNWDY